MSTLQVVARRVGLEAVDYKQILVEKYRFGPDTLGEVKMVNGLLNVSGDVNLSHENLTKLPFKFGKVEGNFWCNCNKLTSLEGAPREVGGDFWCSHNKLTSLEGAPKEVGGHFICRGSMLTSLEGAPLEVGGDFNCEYNQLTSLEGAPLEVGGGFWCNGNKLTSLEGAPKKVGGAFRCDSNNLPENVKRPAGIRGKFYAIVQASQQDDLTVASALIDEACEAVEAICSVLDEQVEHIEQRFVDPIKTATRILFDQLSSCGIYIEQYSLKHTELIKTMALRASEAAFKSSCELTKQISLITSIQGWHSVMRNSSVIAHRDIERVLKIIKS